MAGDRAERCGGCGRAVSEGTAGCRKQFEELLARDFSNVLYFRMHRMLVDTYSLQHPAEYCASAKSLAAHLTGLAWLLEHGGSRATGSDLLRRWLDGRSNLSKPEIPSDRGRLTIDDVRRIDDPIEYERAVERWARSTWAAYVGLHGTARRWIDGAISGTREGVHT